MNYIYQHCLSNYAIKADLEVGAGVNASKFVKKFDLTSLKSEFHKLDIDELEKAPNSLNSLKSKVNKLNVDKIVPVSFDLSKLSDVVKKGVVKKDVCNANIKDIEDKTPDFINL